MAGSKLHPGSGSWFRAIRARAILFPMNSKYRGAIFLAIGFALMVPYLGFVTYWALRFPSGHWPAWLTNTIGLWFTANFLILLLVARRIFRGQVVEQEKARRAAAISKSISWYLVILWSLFFLYGTVETIKGKLPLDRAVPAGVFLLFFIGIFGWSLYRTSRRKA
jgi:hypothetical protein